MKVPRNLSGQTPGGPEGLESSSIPAIAEHRTQARIDQQEAQERAETQAAEQTRTRPDYQQLLADALDEADRAIGAYAAGIRSDHDGTFYRGSIEAPTPVMTRDKVARSGLRWVLGRQAADEDRAWSDLAANYGAVIQVRASRTGEGHTPASPLLQGQAVLIFSALRSLPHIPYEYLNLRTGQKQQATLACADVLQGGVIEYMAESGYRRFDSRADLEGSGRDAGYFNFQLNQDVPTLDDTWRSTTEE